jgi:glycyl-tRNA synthetase
MTNTLDFQSIVMTLQNYWADYGCLIWQPYYSQVGAGTMNPATFLRVLGPEPWNVAYVEPSIRPDDGRYGENPNRLQMHYQFQVILKPDPGNPQALYLNSLKALGIDPRQHDIRFVEDNWEQPAIGAWGLGWEVWLDGQEITQFTYFQQAGGIVLDPVSVELTYGLERIAIALQRVSNFRDIQWNSILTDGDVNLQAEQEHSKYYFEIADIERLRKMYSLFEAEAETCLEQGLVLPAYDYILKCSHTFNMLDTRGAVGVTERQALFGRMRELARRVSETYIEQRTRLDYPFIKNGADVFPHKLKKGIDEKSNRIHAMPISKPSPFLLEIGTEEIPAKDLDSAISQLEKLVEELLNRLRLPYQGIHIHGTPRRLVVHVEGLSPRQDDLEQVVKGPPANRSFDKDGVPTKAAEGFALSKGVSIDQLEVREIDGGNYVTAVVRESGKDTLNLLSEELPTLIAGIRFDKTMRWNYTNIAFSRPIRWILAIYGEGEQTQVVPFEYAGLHSSNFTHGLRFHEPEKIEIESMDAYFEAIEKQGILLDIQERRNVIQNLVQDAALEVGGSIPDDPALLAEVANLVEAPTVLRGEFEAKYLDLPKEVLVSVMKKHQRYFPVVPKDNTSSSDQLLPHFIAIRNGEREWMDIVKEGNEQVIRARFADAEFFINEDLREPLEDYVHKLYTLTFQVKLGSMLDKTKRLVELVDSLTGLVKLSEEERETARRAAYLCKADLTTKMVIEMTSLQGQMGRYYALSSGETNQVAQAIYDHYLPRFAGDEIPRGKAGLMVGLADRLDSLTGLFSAGLAPSGNKDPFALRRAALGLVQNLIHWDIDFDLLIAIREAAKYLPIETNEEDLFAVKDFIIERLRNLLLEQGARYDIVDAVLAAQGDHPARASHAVLELGKWVSRSDWDTILPAFSRCVRITRDMKTSYSVNSGVLVQREERDLFEAVDRVINTHRSEGSVDDFLSAFLPLIPLINQFFDEVLVMVDDAKLRENRLGLLQQIASMADHVADMSRLEGF